MGREGSEKVMVLTNDIIPHDAQIPIRNERAEIAKVQVFSPTLGPNNRLVKCFILFYKNT